MKNQECLSYTLGLDIGMASVGAALLAHDHIHALHVRAFNKAETADRGESLNKVRRDSRSTRRRLRRRALRLLQLRRMFKRKGLLPDNSTTHLTSVDQSPWTLRAEGLDRLLTPVEWASTLYHLVKHRGFQSTRKREVKTDEKAGQMLNGVNHNSQLLEAGQFRTVGELAAKHDAFKKAKRNKGGSYTHTFARSDVESELRLLFVAQRKLANAHADEAFERGVHTLLMARRPALSGKSLLEKVGYCTFEQKERRIPKACYTAERFVWLTRLNNLRINDQGHVRPLNTKERDAVISLPYTLSSKVSYKQIRTKGDLPETARFLGVNYWEKRKEGNELAAEETALFEAKHFYDLRKAYKQVGLSLEWQRDSQNVDRLDSLGYALTVFKEDNESRQWLQEQGVEDAVIEAILELSYSKFLHLSRTALLKITPGMLRGMRYDEAVQAAGYNHHSVIDSGQKSTLLPAFSRDDIINPVVYRSLNQARKLVNAIIKHYGPPSAVHIELARDLSKPFDERKRIEREQKEFRETKQEDIERFIQQFEFTPKGLDLVKWRLYREQDCKCAYSLKPLDLNRLYEAGYAEIDHALPYSRSFDDSMNNKVLVLTSENRNKGSRTPFEYLDGKSDSQQWREFSAWVTGNKKIRQAKRNKLLRKEFGKDEAEKFRERNLTDTRYACRLFKNHVEQHLQLAEDSDSKRCVVVAGQLTAFLRARWGLIKVREDGDTHHALDAAVVAACGHAFVQRLANHARKGELEYLKTIGPDPETGEIVDIAALRQLEKDFPKPWEHFRQELLEKLSTIRVSRAPQRRGSGAAHQDTIRSAKQLDARTSSVKVSLNRLRLQDLPRIVGAEDQRNEPLITALRQRLEAHNGDGKKAFAEPIYKPCKAGKENSAPLVRSVRLTETQKSGLPVRGGIANNGDMLRVDLFTKAGKYFAVPLYVSDSVKTELPRLAVARGKNGWIEMDESFRFLFSLHTNDWVRVEVTKDSTKEGYFGGFDISTGAINIWAHDRNKIIGKDGLMRGIGIKTALSVDKFHVDLLGNLYPVTNETRQPLRACKKG